MIPFLTTEVHDHVPIYRVVRRGWANPLDSSFSQHPGVDNRWNLPEFPALYCCCSETVARAIVTDIYQFTGLQVEDLQESYLPQLVEIDWSGHLVDLTSEDALAAANLPRDYPHRVEHRQTRVLALSWHSQGAHGVLSRSASMARLGQRDWSTDHRWWCEIAIYPHNAPVAVLRRRRNDLDWI